MSVKMIFHSNRIESSEYLSILSIFCNLQSQTHGQMHYKVGQLRKFRHKTTIFSMKSPYMRCTDAATYDDDVSRVNCLTIG